MFCKLLLRARGLHGPRVPVVLPDGYPGNKLPEYGSPIHGNTRGRGDGVGKGTVFTDVGRHGIQFLSPCRPLLGA